MLYTAYAHEGPAAARYPRGQGPGVDIAHDMEALPLGKSRTIRSGTDVTILSFGSMLTPAKAVADALNATLIDMRFVKPIDAQAASVAAMEHDLVVTLEENALG